MSPIPRIKGLYAQEPRPVAVSTKNSGISGDMAGLTDASDIAGAAGSVGVAAGLTSASSAAVNVSSPGSVSAAGLGTHSPISVLICSRDRGPRRYDMAQRLVKIDGLFS
ncbi:hypothetical protein SDC9_206668 [bioreactor metagenome]|uniref:Uncharacterized protein n=1 Tax=bioreactor metagenome TaxID=1076179 RepID=A0A645J746_9ZZZZ